MRFKIIFIAFYLLLCCFVFWCFGNRSGFLFTALNVGQGDSLVIKTPSAHLVLIDGGGNREAAVYLGRNWPVNSCSLVRVILTHPHADHVAGFARIMEICKVLTATFNDVSYTSGAFTDFKELLRINSVKIDNSLSDFTLDGVRFIFLWPQKIPHKDQKFTNLNDSSIVLFIDYKDFEALLLGDLEAPEQSRLDLDRILPYIQQGLDVLKVSHHGATSGFNEGVVEKLRPKNCVISVGKDNTFGHPAPEVVASLQRLKCRVLRTDREGTIEFKRQ